MSRMDTRRCPLCGHYTRWHVEKGCPYFVDKDGTLVIRGEDNERIIKPRQPNRANPAWWVRDNEEST